MSLRRRLQRERPRPGSGSDFADKLIKTAGIAYLSGDDELLAPLARIRDVSGPMFRDYKSAKMFDLQPHLADPALMAAIKDLEAVLNARSK